MTVYIEYVIIDNFIIDYALLKVALTLNGVEKNKWRLFACAFLGAGLALLFPLIDFMPILSIAIKVFSGILLVMLSARFKSVKQGYKTALTFLLLTFAVGGGIMAIFWAFNLDYGAEISIALIFLPVVALLKFAISVIKSLVKKRENVGFEKDCEIVLSNGKTIKCRGYIDTGNGLYFEGVPVIVANKSFAIKLMASCLPKTYKLFYLTASGKGEMTVFKVNELLIYFEEEVSKIKGVYLGVAKERISADCDFLLHPDLIRKVEDDKCYKQVEKVS
ncbi:MAG: sigma-E processing peptidase SpoIIGA [Clostridia bacterium]|nr:sigma-E processing peptidase SpoIIGA [Clostridia bacterium]